MSERILVVDDDPIILNLLADVLRSGGYGVVTACGGAEALQIFRAQPLDFVVLDVMMPQVDGWTVCRQIREFSNVPVLMLTALDDEGDRLRGFEMGVDDYVVKPFSTAEILARVRAILNRARRGPSEPLPRLIVCGEITVDPRAQHVTRNGQKVNLTRREYDVLLVLAEQCGNTVQTQALIERVWGDNYGEDIVKHYISYLRRKLEDDPAHPRYIITDRGFGYFLDGC